MSEQRLIDLEMKVSYQEATIEALNQVVYDQQKTIDKLIVSLTKLNQRLEALSNEGSGMPPGDERPPHY